VRVLRLIEHRYTPDGRRRQSMYFFALLFSGVKFHRLPNALGCTYIGGSGTRHPDYMSQLTNYKVSLRADKAFSDPMARWPRKTRVYGAACYGIAMIKQQQQQTTVQCFLSLYLSLSLSPDPRSCNLPNEFGSAVRANERRQWSQNLAGLADLYCAKSR
jgi:hypothetical protein